MDRQEAVEAYADRFGGFPYFLFMGAEDDYVVEAVRGALEADEPIRAPEDAIF